MVLPALLAAALIVAAMRGGSYENVARREMFVLVWWSLGLAGALGLLPRSRLPLAAKIAVGALVAFAAWVAVDAIGDSAFERAATEAIRSLGFTGTLLLVGWTFTRHDWRTAAGFLTLAAMVICILAFASRLIPSVLPSAINEAGIDTRRLGYPLNYWNAVGVWAAMTTALGLSWSAHAERWWLRGLALAGVSVAIPVVYMTYSRTAAIVTVVAALVVIGLSVHRWLALLNLVAVGLYSAAVIYVIRENPAIANYTGTDGAVPVAVVALIAALGCMGVAYLGSAAGVAGVRMPRQTARTALIAGLVVAIAFAFAAGPTLADKAWDSFNQATPASKSPDAAGRLTNLSGERRLLWETALDTFKAQPLTGSGAGTFEFEWNQSPHWSHTVRDAHSLYLETLAETGLPGALIMLVVVGALLVAVIGPAVRSRVPGEVAAAAGCAGAFVAYVIAAGVDWMWESTAVTLLAFAAAMVTSAGQGADAPPPRARTRIGITAAALGVMVVLVPALVSSQQLNESQAAARAGQPNEAVATATTAIRLQPWSARAYQQRALVLEKSGLLAAAAKDARKAVDLETANFENWLILGRIEVERGHTAAGLRAARRAQRLHPSGPEFSATSGAADANP